MILSQDEEIIIEGIKDGNSNSRQLILTTGFKTAKVKEVLSSLSKKGVILIIKKFDSNYNEEVWEVELT
ncbi:MAG TPA: hypothetical protein VJB94_01650 [Candidatus Nanoarchaeia archaeon]|nr:hypothetical protein [Candidatus Nanoarchaeia archaeon]